MNKFLLIFCVFIFYSSVQAGTDLIVTNHPKCTEMGKLYMQRYNVTAPELAIIITTCEGIVNPHYSGLGGGFIATVFNGNCQQSKVINAREISPMSYTTMTARNYNEIGVPSMLVGYIYLYTMKMCEVSPVLPWKDLFAENIKLAQNGWAVIPGNEKFVNMLKDIRGHTIEISSDRKRMKNPVLARTLENIASTSQPSFYLENQMIHDFYEVGSLIQLSDIQNYRLYIQTPDTSVKFRNYTIITSTIPGSGFTFILGCKIVEAVFESLTSLSSEDRKLFMYHTLRYMYSLKPFLKNPLVLQDEVILL